jgi:hypothetical protein
LLEVGRHPGDLARFLTAFLLRPLGASSIWLRAAEVCCVAAACCWVPRLIWPSAAMIWREALDSFLDGGRQLLRRWR